MVLLTLLLCYVEYRLCKCASPHDYSQCTALSIYRESQLNGVGLIVQQTRFRRPARRGVSIPLVWESFCGLERLALGASTATAGSICYKT